MTKKMWGGRFSKPTHPVIERFTSSIAVDQRLAPYDARASIAHVQALGKARLLTAAETRRLTAALAAIARAAANGAWHPDPRAEDVHSAIQQAVAAKVGALARKLQTGRSRNEQVSVAERLYCKAVVPQLTAGLRALQRALCDVAQRHRDVVMPGYTHLKRAQPVLLAHHLLAYLEMCERDIERLQQALVRADVLPSGSGALAGSSLPIDRRYLAKLLGFARISANSMDAVADRDFLVELSSAVALSGVHLSRLAEDLVLWASDEFGFIELDDRVATGSSLMPHKKNPDVLELVRGQTGQLIGAWVALATMLKGLPLTYNRDLQHDKAVFFSAIDLHLAQLEAVRVVIQHLRINREAIRRSVQGTDVLCATDVAEQLVCGGMAFGEAHERVGRLVALAQRRGCQLRQLPLQEIQRVIPGASRALYAVLDPERSVQAKRTIGSTNPSQVRSALNRWRQVLRG